MKSKELSLWNEVQNSSINEMKERDALDFLEKSKEYIEEYIFNKDENNYNPKVGLHFITGLWGSGKSSFINFILWQLEENKDKYIQGKKLLPIFFNPRHFQSSENIYEYFLETITSALLQAKYDKKIKKNSKELLYLLDKSGHNYLSFLSHLFLDKNESFDNKIKAISQSIKETYKDYFIIIIIDEIDRVGKEDIVNIGKILNIIKKISYMNKGNNLLGLYSADSRHLYSFNFSDENIENPINFYQYFKKFSESKYDIHENSKKEIFQYIVMHFSQIFEKIDQSEREKMIDLFNRSMESIQGELENLGSSITMRDIIFILNEIELLKSKLEQRANKVFQKTTLNLGLINEYQINEYIEDKLFDITFLLNLIYFISIIEKDPTIISILNELYSEINHYHGLNTRENDREKINLQNIEKVLKKLGEEKKIKFSYMLQSKDNDYFPQDLSKNFLDFMKSEYLYIKEIIINITPLTWEKYIESKFEETIGNQIIHNNLEINIKNGEFLFSGSKQYNKNLIFSFSQTHLLKIRHIIQKEPDPTKWMKFYNKIVDFIPVLIDKNNLRNRSDIDHIIGEATTISAEIYQRSNDYITDNNKSEWKEILSISRLLSTIDSYIQDDETLFIGFYFYSRLYSYSKSQDGSGYNIFEKNIKDTLDCQNDITNYQTSNLGTINNDNYQGSFFLGYKSLKSFELLLNQSHNKKIEEILNDFFIKLGKDDQSEKEENQYQILTIISRIIYNVFEHGVLEYKIETIIDFMNKYMSLNYQFLLLCLTLEYDSRYFRDKTIKVYTDQERINLGKKVYINLKEKLGNKFLEDLIEKNFNNVFIKFTHNSQVKYHNTEFILNNINKNDKDGVNKLKEDIKKGLLYFSKN